MKIQNVQLINFQGKKPLYISDEQLYNAQNIIKKMDKGSTIDCNERVVLGKMVQRVKYKDAEFQQEFWNLNNHHPRRYMLETSTLEFSNSKIKFRNDDGRIIDCKKPFFTSWKKFMKKVDDYLDTMNIKYNEKEVYKEPFFFAFHTDKFVSMFKKGRK